MKDINYIRGGFGKSFKFGYIFTFDSEAYKHTIEDKQIQTLAIWDIFDGENHYQGDNLSLLEKKIKEFAEETLYCTFFAHNIKYDLQVTGLWKKIINNDFDGYLMTKVMIDTSVFIELTSYDHKIKINFIDSMNYFRTSLRELSKSFNLESKVLSENEYQLEDEVWNKLLDDKKYEIVKYDTEILYHVIDRFLQDNIIIKGLTTPSSALKTFKKNFLSHTISFPKFLSVFALESYRGGLVFPFQLLRGQYINDYDINSLYPTVMRNYQYSIKFREEIHNIKQEDISSSNLNYLLNVDFYGDNNLIVPVRGDDKRLIFVDNVQNVWITSEEYKTLIDNNFEVIVNKGYSFFRSPIFFDYVNYFYDLKKRNLNGNKSFYKLMLNSLYGKFGENRQHTELILIDDINKLALHNIDQNMIAFMKETGDNDGKGKLYDFGDFKVNYFSDFVIVKKESEVKYDPVIASEVTANARLYNFRYRQKIKKVYNTDTDSFFTPLKMEESDELGDIKLEFQGRTWLYAPKDYFYITNDNILNLKLKGVQTNNAYQKFIELGYINSKHEVIDNSVFNEKINVYVFDIEKFSNFRRKPEENVVIEFDQKIIKRIPLKMKYNSEGTGFPFKDMKDYISYRERMMENVLDENTAEIIQF